ncbi:MAG: hypothetical protein ACRC67_33395 [Inquilinus sp.]|uniref:hypothetical protein n=1 Tax=Inquilinus sp. TaxID=1932117 RepID=UPI003F2CF358
MTTVNMDQNESTFNASRGEAGESFALAIREVEGEPRILDIDLATRLGFAEPRMIRKLIKRHLDALDRLGMRSTVERIVKGRPSEEFYLNRKQAIFVTGKSDTPTATEITIEIIERFDAYERAAAPILAPAAQAAMIDDEKGWKTWLDLVRETRILKGRRAAIALWETSPLPSLPAEGDIGQPGAAQLRAFLTECTEQAPGEKIGADWLYMAYMRWCTANDLRKASQTWFGRHVPVEKQISGTVRYIGLRLREQWEC